MKINFFLVFLFSFFMSCKPQGPEAKWVYGTWYEVLDGGKVEFKKGGKVFWFGSSGTFTFEKKSTFICGGGGCDDGEIVVKADGDTLRFGYRVNKGQSKPKIWNIKLQKYGGLAKSHKVKGRETRNLFLSSTKAGGGPFKLANFERMDKGLYKYNSMSSSGVVNGELVSNLWWGTGALGRFDNKSKRWEVFDESLTSGSLYYGKNVLIHSGFTSAEYSLNAGRSWSNLPKLEDEIGTSSGFYETTFLGKRIFNIEQEQAGNGKEWEDPRLYKIYSIDLSKSSPKWSKVFDVPSSLTTNLYQVKLYSSEEKGELYLLANPTRNHNKKDLKVKMYLSKDKGLSFTEIGLPEFDHVGQARTGPKGIVVIGWKKVGEKNVYSANFLNTDADSWRSIQIERELYSWYPYKDTILVFNWMNGLDLLKEDGSLAPFLRASNLSENAFQSPQLHVFNDEVYFSSYTIWKYKNK